MKPLQTVVTAQVLDQPKSKNSKLTFDAPASMRTYPLFEITSDRDFGQRGKFARMRSRRATDDPIQCDFG